MSANQRHRPGCDPERSSTIRCHGRNRAAHRVRLVLTALQFPDWSRLLPFLDALLAGFWMPCWLVSCDASTTLIEAIAAAWPGSRPCISGRFLRRGPSSRRPCACMTRASIDPSQCIAALCRAVGNIAIDRPVFCVPADDLAATAACAVIPCLQIIGTCTLWREADGE